jgi:hypothetical protein
MKTKSWKIALLIIHVVVVLGIIGHFVIPQKTINKTTESDKIDEINDTHNWNSKPIEINDIDLAKGLFDLSDGYVKAWEVGTYVDGYGYESQLNEAKILLVAIRDIGHGQGPFGTEPMGACDAVTRIFISKPSSGNLFIFYDQHYSPSNILNQGFSFISKNSYPVNDNAQFYFENSESAFIPSLDFPGFVVHDKQVFVLQKNTFPCYVIDNQGKTKMFFDDIKDSLEPKFTDPVLGTAYEDKSSGGIVFRVSDGTYIRYSTINN